MSPRKADRYVVVSASFGLFNVVDRTSGLPAEVDATAVLLNRGEARRLITWLNFKNVSSTRERRGSHHTRSTMAVLEN